MSNEKGPLPPPPSYEEAQNYVIPGPQREVPGTYSSGYSPYPPSSQPGTMPQPVQGSAFGYQPPPPGQSSYAYSGGYQPPPQPQQVIQPQMDVASPYAATTQPYPAVIYTQQGQTVMVPSGYTTTPLAYGNQTVYDSYRRKRIAIVVLCAIVGLIVVVIIFGTIF